jgi:hypothetical protein
VCQYGFVVFIHLMGIAMKIMIVFKRKYAHINAHRYQAQANIFWVDCYCRIKIMSITLSNTYVYDRFIKCSLVMSRFKK